VFYPLRVPKSKWLEYYAARFRVGEVNATYYGLLPTSTFSAACRGFLPCFFVFGRRSAIDEPLDAAAPKEE
jgi:uncharacterized protein YecE (DUF72 family)